MTSAIKAWSRHSAAQPEFCLDEAEAATFNSMVLELPTFDARTAHDLEGCAWSHPEPRERERALWELCYRDIANKGQLLQRCFQHETHALVKANLLWLALKVAPEQAPSLIQTALRDDEREVRDWARLYHSEITGTPFDSEYRGGVVIRGRHFDQTMPLQIAGFAVVDLPDGDRRVVLSPLWFAYIQGRVMACTRDDTFMTDLTIEKAYFNFHPDGSHHYEIYPFRGKSWHTPDGRTQHRYLAKSLRPTYLSGRVEEDPSRTLRVPMIVGRVATTGPRLLRVSERDAGAAAGDTFPAIERRVVSNVRGQYLGWAHASLRHYLQHGDILPGTVQLVSPVEPETASLVNCYICGTFRGKISDHNGDGLLDVNEVVCHGAPDGRLDYLGDGSFQPDPFE